MRFSIVVATHHKTGTVWMDGVFKSIASAIGCTYLELNTRNIGELDRPSIFFSPNSDFGNYRDFLWRDDVRVFHLIRDPRDVLISAMHYHSKASEAWLHKPLPDYDNRTYQQKLKELKTSLERYVFEMENTTSSTIRDMVEWQYDRANCVEARYEELRQDRQMNRWSKIVAALGFEEAEQAICRQMFWNNSLFGNLMLYGSKHVRCGDVAQWTREFTPALAAAFLERFPTVLQYLRYETSNDWVDGLQPRKAGRFQSVVKRVSARLAR